MYLIIILVLIFLLCNQNEGYTGYMENKSTHDYPDDTVFFACSENLNVHDCNQYDKLSCDNNRNCIFQNNQCINKKYPNTHYKVTPNAIKEPLEGTFSAFLDVNKIRTYDHFYHAPICENTYSFDTDINSQFRLIPGAFPEENISVIYEEELQKDSHDLRNPFFIYGNPRFIQNKITYEDEINDMFLKVKEGLPLHHEDDSHYEGINSPYTP